MTYKITCLNCLRKDNRKVVYLGESARSLWDRISEHIGDLRRRTTSSVLYRHWQEGHQDEAEPEFSVEVLGCHRSSTERQIKEALEIQRGKYDELINNKSKWGMNCLVRHGTKYDKEVHQGSPGEGDQCAAQVVDARRQEHPSSSSSSFTNQFRQRQREARSAKEGQGVSRKRGRKPPDHIFLTPGHGTEMTMKDPNSKRCRTEKC